MTQPRFRTAGLRGAGLLLPSVDALLDALDAGRLGPDDFVFDVERQAWLRPKEHPELRVAWADRQRFRPMDDRSAIERLPDAALAYPALDDGGTTPAHGTIADDLDARRAAFRALRASRPPSLPFVDLDASVDFGRFEKLLGRLGLAFVLLLVALVGASIVGLASGFGRLMTLELWRR